MHVDAGEFTSTWLIRVRRSVRTLCVGAVLCNTLATFSVWSPRHVLWLDEMRLGPRPPGNEQVDGLPRQDEHSQWCRCVVTYSEGTRFYFCEGTFFKYMSSYWCSTPRQFLLPGVTSLGKGAFKPRTVCYMHDPLSLISLRIPPSVPTNRSLPVCITSRPPASLISRSLSC